MKRVLIYGAILASVAAVPVCPLKIGQMLPVKVVAIYKEGARTVIETDTKNKGVGDTAVQALCNMKDTASGIIYLDTAQYLLLTKDTEEAAEELREELRPGVRLCRTETAVNLEEAARYLDAHGKLPKLKAWEKGAELPLLGAVEDSLIFLKKVENNA